MDSTMCRASGKISADLVSLNTAVDLISQKSAKNHFPTLSSLIYGDSDRVVF